MKVSSYILFIGLICLFLVSSSCEKETNTRVETTVNDPMEENGDDTDEDAGLQFVSIIQSVTLEVCGASYCDIEYLVFLTEDIGYAVSGVDVYKTIDGGENWEIIRNEDIVGKLIPISEDLMFLNTFYGVSKTTDAGATWTYELKPFPLECQPSAHINRGTIHFVDRLNGFIVGTACYTGDLFRTTDSGATWEQVYNSEDEISEYYFEDDLNGFVILNDTIYLTSNGGADWQETEVIPSSFDYVIEKEDYFLFPEGTPNVNKPDIVDENISVTNFDVNDVGDIVVILYDTSVTEDNWQLMLYVNEDSEWILVDKLDHLEDGSSVYNDIYLTNEKTMYMAMSNSGDIVKYYKE